MMNSKHKSFCIFLPILNSLFLFLFLQVGQMIGTGIFSNPSLILINSGSGGMMLILWVVGAIFAGAGVWCYLELGTMLPRR
ncbi:hypothetical protein EDC96DRAFT_529450 [Choanephora cucurbitarum]|nr:hypothetical protein EDC96DRAFT_529450 [Choanephora cucurbitarum]